MKNIAFLFLLLFVAACNKAVDPKDPDIDPDLEKMFLYENQAFSLRFPTQEWKFVPLQGTDSFVGYYEKGNDKIYFDHGWYNGTIDKNKVPKPLYLEETTINGRKAIIAKETTNEGTVLTAIIKKGGDDLFTSTKLEILNPTNEQEIIRIFKTHQFK